MCIQDSAAGPAGTMDSTAVAAAWQQSQSLLAETDQPEKKTKTLWCYDRKLREQSSFKLRNDSRTKVNVFRLIGLPF